MRSPWIPILLLLLLGAYLAPKVEDRPGTPVTLNLDFQPRPRLLAPEQLSPEARELFYTTQAATVRVEQAGGGMWLSRGIGTGFFISEDGELLTAYHVIEDGGDLSVLTASGRRLPARLIGFDSRADLALLKVNTRVPALPLSVRAPRVGEQVLAVGNGRGQFLQPRQGRLQRVGVTAGRADFPSGTLEFNAPIAQGDSGGPVVNAAGEVIGVVSYIRLGLGEEALAAYAVPVNVQSPILSAMRAGLRREAAGLGVGGSVHAGLYPTAGAVIGSVVPGSPAARAGIRAERFVENPAEGEMPFAADIITHFNGRRLLDFGDLSREVRSLFPGDAATLRIVRGEEALEVTVELAPLSSIRRQ